MVGDVVFVVFVIHAWLGVCVVLWSIQLLISPLSSRRSEEELSLFSTSNLIHDLRGIHYHSAERPPTNFVTKNKTS